MAQDMAQDVAEGASGAAEDGGVNVLILPIAIFQRRNPQPTEGYRSPHRPWATRKGRACEGRAREGRSAGCCGGRGGESAIGRGAGPGLRGPGRRAPSSPRHHHRRRRLCAARAEIGAQLGSSVAFGSGCGQALPGMSRKAPLCIYPLALLFFIGGLAVVLIGIDANRPEAWFSGQSGQNQAFIPAIHLIRE